nr:L431 [uncultured bacterium]
MTILLQLFGEITDQRSVGYRGGIRPIPVFVHHPTPQA